MNQSESGQQSFDMSHREVINKLTQQILDNNIQSSMASLLILIAQDPDTGVEEFRGDGVAQWFELGDEDPLLLVVQQEQKGQCSRNPFDLLSICCRILLSQQPDSIQCIINHYQGLMQKLGLRHEILVGKGNAYFNNGQYLKAQNEYLKALKLKETEKLYENLCMLAYRCGHHPCLDNFIWKCRQFNEKSVCAQFTDIFMSHKRSQIKELRLSKIFRLSNLCARNPQCYLIDYEVSHLLQQRGLSHLHLQRILERHPNSIKVKILLIDNLKTRRKFCEESIRQNAHREICHLELGDNLSGKSFLGRAAYQHYLKVLELNPNNLKAIKSMAYDERYGEEASSLYRRFIELNPYCAQVFINLSQCFHRRDKEQVRQLLERAIEVDPQYHLGHYKLGKLHLQQKQLSLAVKELEIAMRLDSISFSPKQQSYGNIMQCYWGLQDYEKVYQFILKQEMYYLETKKSNSICFKFGLAAYHLGHKRDAMRTFLNYFSSRCSAQEMCCPECMITFMLNHCVDGTEKTEVVTILQDIMKETEISQKNVYLLLLIASLFDCIGLCQESLKLAFRVIPVLGSRGSDPFVQTLSRIIGNGTTMDFVLKGSESQKRKGSEKASMVAEKERNEKK